jgi:hypothetical protein
MSLVIIFILILKFCLPVGVILAPFAASWANFVLDSIDGDILMHIGLNPASYQLWDKAADYWTYIFLFMVGRRWRIGKQITLLFLVRIIGQALYFLTSNELFLFLFPNFLEPLFMVYSLLIFTHKSETKAHQWYKKHLILIWIIIITYKMWNEYNIHVGRIDLSQKYFGINN